MKTDDSDCSHRPSMISYFAQEPIRLYQPLRVSGRESQDERDRGPARSEAAHVNKLRYPVTRLPSPHAGKGKKESYAKSLAVRIEALQLVHGLRTHSAAYKVPVSRVPRDIKMNTSQEAHSVPKRRQMLGHL